MIWSLQRGARLGLPARFWDKVEKTYGCWIWRGSLTRFGHGAIRGDNGKTLKAHRVAWELANGKIEENLFVRHSCDNPSCVNPGHLAIGTHADNMTDMKMRGRAWKPRGESHPMARLNGFQVQCIRYLRKRTALTLSQIGLLFGVEKSSISNIARRKAWAHT